MVTADDLNICNGMFSEVITVDGCTILGIVSYDPDNPDYPVTIYEDSCCEMTILGLDDIQTIYCGDHSSDGNLPNSCCVTAPTNNPILYANFQNLVGCDCLNNLTVPIVYLLGYWEGGYPACGLCNIDINFFCLEQSNTGLLWGIRLYFSNMTCLVGSAFTNISSCSPFIATFANLTLDNTNCGCGCSGLINVIITDTV